MANAIKTFQKDLGSAASPGYVVHPGDIKLPPRLRGYGTAVRRSVIAKRLMRRSDPIAIRIERHDLADLATD